ncbi:hypothetical protein K474DRAFT_1769559 [Panus rudis PR-1116 ss-1]|nr:hypothetical protein K474DRAFT_1769559 [Panus rudis PR-1116 ss-1]
MMQTPAGLRITMPPSSLDIARGQIPNDCAITNVDERPASGGTTPKPVLSCAPSRNASEQSRGNAGITNAEAIGLRSLRGLENLKLGEGVASLLDPIPSRGAVVMQNTYCRVADTGIPHVGDNSTRSRSNRSTFSTSAPLPSYDTMLNLGDPSTRGGAQLKALLGNSHARVKPKVTVMPPAGHVPEDNKGHAKQIVTLEQAKHRARVEVDIILDSCCVVQGGYLRGHLKIRVRKRTRKEAPILLSGGKIRIVGFETIPHQGNHHTFYQCAAPISAVTDASQGLYDTSADGEGYARAVEGIHVLPFAMRLPIDSTFGQPKGVLDLPSGIFVRYIAMISIKVKDAESGKQSIAHFYRDCEVWPLLQSTAILSPAPRPLQAATAKSLSIIGNSDKVKLTANLLRLHWIAGQRCHVRILVHNGSKKTVKNLTLTLVRTVTVFKPRPSLNAGDGCSMDPDACQTATTHKMITESILEMASKSTRGHASAKGWWTGVKPGQQSEFTHYILLPPDALSITRGRLLEVEYSIRVTLSAGSLAPEVFVTLPIRIINFLSIDPPATRGLLSPSGAYARTVKDNTLNPYGPFNSDSLDQPPTVARSTRARPTYEPVDSFRTVPSTVSQLIGSANNSLASCTSALQVTNPDVEDTTSPSTSGPIQASLFESTAESKSSLSSTSSIFLGDDEDRQLANLECAADFESDTELACVMESVKLEQRGLVLEDERASGVRINTGNASTLAQTESTINGKIGAENLSDVDEGYGSNFTSPIDSPISSPECNSQRGMAGIGLTSFARRVEEKLAATTTSQCSSSASSTDSSIAFFVRPTPSVVSAFQGSSSESCVDQDIEEATPRMASAHPVTQAAPPELSAAKARLSVRGPRGSRVLPRPPLHSASTSECILSTNFPQSSSASCVPLSSVISPENHDSWMRSSNNRPIDALAQVGESSSSVKRHIAALEERMRLVQGSGSAYV